MTTINLAEALAKREAAKVVTNAPTGNRHDIEGEWAPYETVGGQILQVRRAA